MLESLTRESFEARQGETFHVRFDDGTALELRLAEIRGATAKTARVGREPFSLVFRGPPRPILPQRTYALENSQMGSLPLFLVPLGPDAGEMRYEAVFS